MSSPPTGTRTRREEILDEATQLFAERGYEGTSMSDLAERVGLRKASLFHHFTSKDVLYAAVLGRLLESVGQSIARSALAPGTFEERAAALSDAITDLLGAEPFAARLLVREVMDWGPVARSELADQVIAVSNAAVMFVQAGQEAGAFVVGDPKQLVISLIGVHFMPFAIGRLVTGLIGTDPSDAAFIAPRRAEVREHVLRLMMAKR
jgi:AcrR family transcriptional regulator